jgi:hypothetical protein
MPFNVRLENGDGAVLGEVSRVLGDFLPDYNDLSFPLLRLVDPYDETVFNRLQTKVLIEEWRRLQDRARDVEQHGEWSAVMKLADNAVLEPMRYLRFIGD